MKESALNLFNLLLEIVGNLEPIFLKIKAYVVILYFLIILQVLIQTYKAFFIGATINFVIFFSLVQVYLIIFHMETCKSSK